MSSNPVSAATVNLSQLFQRLANTPQAQDAAAPAAATATSATSPDQQVQGTGHRHHGHHGGGDMFKKIESAVTSALQSAQSNGSTDPNKTIEDAIAKVFQDGGASSTSTTPAADSDGGNDGSTAGAASNQNDAAARQAFFQTLKSYGVDPQQFRKDLMAAMKDAQSGQADPSAAFKSFPPGVALDTAA